MKGKFKLIFKKIKEFWKWLWYSSSIWSWIILFILAFLIVRFVFFPFFGLILHSEFPFVIVESYSMQHCHAIYKKPFSKCNFDEYWINFGEWYEKNNLTKKKFEKFPFKNGLNAGDIAVVKGKKEYEIGDIIVFRVNKKPIIHRIVKKRCKTYCIYETKGDNNKGQLEFEQNIKEDQIIGKAIFVIPKLGWVKLFFFKLIGLA